MMLRSLRHLPAWHHPSINITEPPEFSLVDDLVCLPLEEIYFEDVVFRSIYDGLAVFPDLQGPNGTKFDLWNHTTWNCNPKNLPRWNVTEFGFANVTNLGHPLNGSSYFSLLQLECGMGRALVRQGVSSLNPQLAIRDVAYQKCVFAPFTELNAMRWSGRARLEWSADLRTALEYVKYGNQTLPRGWQHPSIPDPAAARPFLPDTLRRLTIKRTNDATHPSRTWTGKPVVRGFLPAEWALLKNLEYLDLSDDMGEGLIEGPIPSTWMMMTKLRIMFVSYRIDEFCRQAGFVLQRLGRLPSNFPKCGSVPPHYYGKGFMNQNNNSRYFVNVKVFDMDGAGWQWFDKSTGEAGYTNVIAPDSKCCWDTFSMHAKEHQFTISGPDNVTDFRDYSGGTLQQSLDVCETSRPLYFGLSRKATGPKPRLPPATFAMPSIARGPFYIVIAAPAAVDVPGMFCRACSCNLAYAILDRGVSAFYTSSPRTTRTTAQSATADWTEISLEGMTSSEVVDPAGGRHKDDYYGLSGGGGQPVDEAAEVVVSRHHGLPLQQQQHRGRQLRQQQIGPPSPPPAGTLPTLDQLLERGLSNTAGVNRGVLKTGNLNTTAPPGVDGETWKRLDSIWRMEPGVQGDYLFRIQAASGVTAPFIRYMVALINTSEPVQKPDLEAVLQLVGGVSLLSSECFESADAAKEISSKAAFIASTTVVAAVGLSKSGAGGQGWSVPSPAVNPALLQLDGRSINLTALSGVSYVQSCLATMYAPEGNKVSVILPEFGVVDWAGNVNRGPLVLEPRLPGTRLASAHSSSRVVGGFLVAVFLLPVLTSRWSSVQSMHHVQMLAMSATMASPGVIVGYRLMARNLRWSVFSVKGNLPALDKAFPSNNLSDYINILDHARSVLGLDTQRSINRTAAETPGAARDDGIQAGYRIGSYPSLDALISWLKSVNELNSSDSGAGADAYYRNASNSNSSSARSTYVIAGAIAAGYSDYDGGYADDVVTLDSAGRVLNKSSSSSTGWNYNAAPPPMGGNRASSGAAVTIMTDIQDVRYTLVVSAIAMGSLLTLHALVAFHFRLRSGVMKDLPPQLSFPRPEVNLGGLILVALAFIASSDLAAGPSSAIGTGHVTPAVLVLVVAVVPYLLFMWWLTVCRWYLVVKVREYQPVLWAESVSSSKAGWALAYKLSVARVKAALFVGRSRHLLSAQKQQQQQQQAKMQSPPETLNEEEQVALDLVPEGVISKPHGGHSSQQYKLKAVPAAPSSRSPVRTRGTLLQGLLSSLYEAKRQGVGGGSSGKQASKLPVVGAGDGHSSSIIATSKDPSALHTLLQSSKDGTRQPRPFMMSAQQQQHGPNVESTAASSSRSSPRGRSPPNKRPRPRRPSNPGYHGSPNTSQQEQQATENHDAGGALEGTSAAMFGSADAGEPPKASNRDTARRPDNWQQENVHGNRLQTEIVVSLHDRAVSPKTQGMMTAADNSSNPFLGGVSNPFLMMGVFNNPLLKEESNKAPRNDSSPFLRAVTEAEKCIAGKAGHKHGQTKGAVGSNTGQQQQQQQPQQVKLHGPSRMAGARPPYNISNSKERYMQYTSYMHYNTRISSLLKGAGAPKLSGLPLRALQDKEDACNKGHPNVMPSPAIPMSVNTQAATLPYQRRLQGISGNGGGMKSSIGLHDSNRGSTQGYVMHYNILAGHGGRQWDNTLQTPGVALPTTLAAWWDRQQQQQQVDSRTTQTNLISGTSAVVQQSRTREGSNGFGDATTAGQGMTSEYIPMGSPAWRAAVGMSKSLTPYPGKLIPMDLLDYQPGCWPLRWHLTPTVQFLARFEFLFEEAIGVGNQQAGRETKLILSSRSINHTHKVLCAATFGAVGIHTHNTAQVVALCALQAAIVAYLVLWRPFVEKPRLVMELVCHVFEMVLFICAILLLNAVPDENARTTYLMIACFFVVSLAAILHELWYLLPDLFRLWQTGVKPCLAQKVAGAWSSVRAWLARRKEQQQVAAANNADQAAAGDEYLDQAAQGEDLELACVDGTEQQARGITGGIDLGQRARMQ
ncbi:hypothetical protein VOLCADRAFT_96656 [Volvox carteri f. nagariensis]|uniref:Uncharacterized protein n=1 Tax=Volvox carteri f. nagariensis TaxID=3068 RepID=D8UAP8_VOLCA|nr:uncharacterized protein VOLCADRAFT_96656 [Volvox carteri f. nagariensis]EFJ43191.1 hypothetical protein VOLCADRAFT_96656 [Volvox carteri f. nagariensis]|eukprot:XP_002955766.1 hypothetical protein VOLCADRAFT_96656 [Volvox carteri f. nagariensis]